MALRASIIKITDECIRMMSLTRNRLKKENANYTTTRANKIVNKLRGFRNYVAGDKKIIPKNGAKKVVRANEVQEWIVNMGEIERVARLRQIDSMANRILKTIGTESVAEHRPEGS